jgi:hypothetical protein
MPRLPSGGAAPTWGGQARGLPALATDRWVLAARSAAPPLLLVDARMAWMNAIADTMAAGPHPG